MDSKTVMLLAYSDFLQWVCSLDFYHLPPGIEAVDIDEALDTEQTAFEAAFFGFVGPSNSKRAMARGTLTLVGDYQPFIYQERARWLNAA